ncbi:MAG: hypothetical protein LBG58_11705 [Planctomycetaceae bacterium]|jgi:hypothetical protein|nr:hypothetical protein [Planctomycetaceae bacterium]
MTTQFVSIFKKEFRQQYLLAAAMLLLCFILQLGAFTMGMFPEFFGHTEPSFLGIALFIALLATALYAGAAAAVSFSVEHEEKTFGFLRSLPVSPLSIMLGKTAWVVTGTIFLLIGSLVPIFLGNATNILTEEIGYLGNTEIWLGIGVCIIEAIVWGFFWSPLFRHQIYAVLVAYFCTSLTSFLTIQFSEQKTNILTDYSETAFFRLGITVIVGIAAAFSMLRWFKNTTQQKRWADYFQYKNTVPLSPDMLISPFFTLLCQSVWQSPILLICGFAVLLTLFFGAIFIFTLFSFDRLFLLLVLFVTVFSGCMFGADQRNQSFRFLSRCGISPEKIWWSRVLPFLCICLPLIVLGIFRFIIDYVPEINTWNINNNEFIRILIFSLFFWLIPFSAGTFVSIYCRSMLVSVAFTGVVSALLFLWIGMGRILYQFNPLWTTLPLAVMLLVASRLRVTDWLRERQTWRSLLKPLIPFFITVLIILSVIPLVRIYSIPYISLDEIEAALDKTDFAERLSQEERKKMFQETSARLTQKLTAEDIDRIKAWRRIDFLFQNFSHLNQIVYDLKENRYDKEQLKTYLRNKNTTLKEAIKTMPLFETWLLYNYEIKTRIINGGLEYILLPDSDGNMEKLVLTRCDYFPWEKTRILRRFNWQLRYHLNSCNLKRDYLLLSKDYQAYDDDDKKMRKMLNRIELSEGIFDSLPDDWKVQSNYFNTINLFRLQLVHVALHRWALEQDHLFSKPILPHSLDELVGIYLDEIPRDPKTGAEMEYYPTWNDSLSSQMPPHIYWHGHGLGLKKPDRPCLKLGNTVLDIQFLQLQ